MKADSALISIEKNFNWDIVALKFEMAIARTIKEFKMLTFNFKKYHRLRIHSC